MKVKYKTSDYIRAKIIILNLFFGMTDKEMELLRLYLEANSKELIYDHKKLISAFYKNQYKDSLGLKRLGNVDQLIDKLEVKKVFSEEGVNRMFLTDDKEFTFVL